MRKILRKVFVRCMGAALAVGCAAEPAGDDGQEELIEDAKAQDASSPDGRQGADNDEELDSAEQALGGYSHVTPLRGAEDGVKQWRYLGTGMITSMSLRTGGLVDAVTVSLYQPSNPNNMYSPHDPLLTRGPAGGSGGAAQPELRCPSGYAAYGLDGRADRAVDRLGIVCAEIDRFSGRPITSRTIVRSGWGGSGGKPFRDVCGEGRWLTAVDVGVGTWGGQTTLVRAVQGFCSNAR